MEEQLENQPSADETTPQAGSKKKRFIRIAKELVIYGLILVLGLVVIPKYVFARNIVNGESMENTLNNQDWLIRERVSYYFGDPKRFDMIIFISPATGEEWVKRVIALPGETIQIIDGTVFIDGKELTEDVYGNALIDISGVANEPYTVPEGCYFVMGDNRKDEESWDSRYEEVGCIPKENILGKVVLRIYPFDSFSTF
ncbi:MAG: signal peptidase I [Clostridiales bacterium]|nr:signal peptidase I [Clostridiales bacterium]